MTIASFPNPTESTNASRTLFTLVRSAVINEDSFLSRFLVAINA